MKNILFVMVFLFSAHVLVAQDFVREADKITGKPILRGKITFQNIMKESTNTWFDEGVQAYLPNPTAIEELSNVWKEYRFVIFAGTWCSDTWDMLPKFYKTMLEANISPYSIEMYGVNRAKQSLQEEHKFYKIESVPTIIVMHQKREVGRITESVTASVEEDLAVMMAKDMRELEIKKAEEELKKEELRKAEIMRMTPKQRKKYYAPRPWY